MLNYNTHPFVFHIDKPALEVSADVFSTLPIESTCTFVRARRARVGEGGGSASVQPTAIKGVWAP